MPKRPATPERAARDTLLCIAIAIGIWVVVWQTGLGGPVLHARDVVLRAAVELTGPQLFVPIMVFGFLSLTA
ncbi:hypothetical protein [Botrimarina sp.]|uniref:hypothetical protein n=1 Tax=Botrimarina sp. TaxID=2795802 RepID=UPI0032EF11C0